jgi:Flp pilus assembly protein TadD
VVDAPPTPRADSHSAPQSDTVSQRKPAEAQELQSAPSALDDDDLDEVPRPRTATIVVGCVLFFGALGGIVMVFGGGHKPPPPAPPSKEVQKAAIAETAAPKTALAARPPETGKPAPEDKVAPVPPDRVVAAEKLKAGEVPPTGEKVVGKVLAASGSDYQTLVSEARQLHRRGQTKKTLDVLERAIALNPQGDEALVLLANCYLERGSAQKALAAANSAMAANGSNAEAYLVIGAVQQQLSHKAEARSAYQNYLKLAPRGQYAGEIRSILSTLR